MASKNTSNFILPLIRSLFYKEGLSSFSKSSWLLLSAIYNYRGKNAASKIPNLILNSATISRSRLRLPDSSRVKSTFFRMTPAITTQKSQAGLESLPLVHSDSDFSDETFRASLRGLAQQFNRTGNSRPFRNCLLVYKQHLLGTVADTFQVLREFGLLHSVGGGKCYSTHEPSAQRIASYGSVVIPEPKPLGYGRYYDASIQHAHLIWQAALKIIYENSTIDRVLVLDDNSGVLQHVPASLVNKGKNGKLAHRKIKLVGIEQTASGTNGSSRILGLPFPIIPFADSAVKTWAEYHEVAKIVADKMAMAVDHHLRPLMKEGSPIIGVIGCGRMGKAVIENLVKLGFQVKYFDKDPSRRVDIDGAKFIDHEVVLIGGVDALIDCTGYPLKGKEIISAITHHRGPLVLASASSGDSAFCAFLEHLQSVTKKSGKTPDLLEDIHWTNDAGSSVVAVRGTFPINFDNKEHCMSPRRSLATRALTLLSVFNALDIMQDPELSNSADIYQPSAQGQYEILKTYVHVNADITHEWADMPKETLVERIEKNSWGRPIQIKSTSSPAPRL